MARMSDHFRKQPKKGATTPQSRPIPGREAEMARNNAGGFVFQVDDWSRLDRFLILGSEGGTYYVKEKALTRDNAEVVLRCLQADGQRVVKTIAEVSEAGRAPKNEPALFALAMAMKLGDEPTRKAAHAAFPRVVRIGTHLLHMAEYIQAFGGWGRATRRVFADWYLTKDQNQLAYQLGKYQQRDGWSHRDILRMAHPKASGEQAALLGWAAGKVDGGELVDRAPLGQYLIGLDRVKYAQNAAEVIQCIESYGLTREAIPTNWLNEVSVWDALLRSGRGMPLTAMIRNLGKMTSIGLVTPFSEASSFIRERLGNAEAITRARVHPMAVLVALRTYSQGRGLKGSLTWNAVRPVVNALDAAFYLAFGNVEKTGLRRLIALDVSGSMGSNVAGMPISAREASAAMAMVTARTEDEVHIIGFTAGGRGPTFGAGGRGGMWGTGVTQLDMGTLGQAVKSISGLPFSGTDCSLPALYAASRNLDIDAIEIYTDSETWAGNVQPVEALRKLRHKVGHRVKQVVYGTTSTGFTIADPKDPDSLDVVGFDTAVPNAVSAFLTAGR